MVAIITSFFSGQIENAIAAAFIGLAIPGAPIAGSDVGIVAELAGVDDAVAAARKLAVGSAEGVRVLRVILTHIASFKRALIDDAVAASGRGAVALAAVAVGGVAVVAKLSGHLVDDAIAAGLVRVAAGGASVSGNEVAIVADFNPFNESVAATRRSADVINAFALFDSRIRAGGLVGLAAGELIG